MRFDRLDLNLLVAFDALFDECSVSGAARRLNLSQSAMSGALGRLRTYFEDDLLVPMGRTMVPTPLGAQLAVQVRQALSHIRATITTPIRFNPETANRMFFIIASDYVYDVLLADTLRDIVEEAPGAQFEMMMPSYAALERFGRGEVDIMITLQDYLFEDHPQKLLFEDALAVVAWDGNSLIGDTVSEDDLDQLPYVEVTFGQERMPSLSERMITTLNGERRVDMRVQTFTAVPAALIGTQRIAIMNRRHADHFARHWPLRVMPLPVKAPKLREALQWHSMRRNDDGLHWVKERIFAGARQLTLEAAAEADRR